MLGFTTGTYKQVYLKLIQIHGANLEEISEKCIMNKEIGNRQLIDQLMCRCLLMWDIDRYKL